MTSSKTPLKRPCPECPFRRGAAPGTNPVRLTRARVEDVAGTVLSINGGHFPCHKTIAPGAPGRDRGGVFCAGALIFGEKNGVANQHVRILERLGMYDPREMRDQDDVFDTIDEMMATAVDQPRRRATRTRTRTRTRR